jgi:hypothetical protein
MQEVRRDLNGAWILDKTRGQPSMRGYLETMGVHELAIEAHEKGDLESDTIHVITLTDTTLRLKKLSRVNDFTMEVAVINTNNATINNRAAALIDDDELLDAVLSDSKAKQRTIAISDNPSHVKIFTKMSTINGTAAVTDIKTLITNDVDIHGNILPVGLKQELTITNELNGKTHTTTRYFVPHKMGGDDNNDESMMMTMIESESNRIVVEDTMEED